MVRRHERLREPLRGGLALCGMLAFWTGGDPVRMDHLFRASGLYREKWERAGYREGTISEALRAEDGVLPTALDGQAQGRHGEGRGREGEGGAAQPGRQAHRLRPR